MAYLPEIRDFFAEVSRGNVPGASPLIVTGERDAIAVVTTGSDIWQGTATTVPLPADVGEQLSLVSTNAADAAAGTGTQQVMVHYLDASGAEQEENITLNGVTPVHTVATNIRFVQEIHSASVGSGGVAAGDISAYRFGDATRVYSAIKAGGNASLSSLRMVPVGKTLYLTSFTASASAGKRVVVRLRTTSNIDGTYAAGIFQFKCSVNTLDSSVTVPFQPPLKVPALAIIKASAWTDTPGASVSTFVSGFLV